eukprot:5818200-Amphidinium_carterae.1
MDSLQFFSAFLAVAISGCALKDVHSYVDWCCATDCKSLHDCLAQQNPSTSERRVLIDLSSLREALCEQHAVKPQLPSKILWIPTEWQLTDPLTKLDRKLRQKFVTWPQNPVVKLRGHAHESTTTSGAVPTYAS